MTNDEELDRLKRLPRMRYRGPQASLEAARASEYRWWWEFLRLSKDYWLVCQTSSSSTSAPRTRDRQLARVFLRFGDIYGCTFDEWWQRRGHRLFRERELFPEVKEVARSPMTRERQLPADDHIWLDIPLKLSARTIQRQIGKILRAHEEQRLGDRRLLTTAEFQVLPSRLNIQMLQRIHEVYCLHRELIAKPMALNAIRGAKRSHADYEQRADLFRIGKLLRLSPSNENLIGTAEEIYAKQNQMRVAVSRTLKRAQALIANCEQGVFPSYEPVLTPERRFSEAHREQHQELEAAWWALDLKSELSGDKLDALTAIHYREAERTRQSITGARKRRVIKQTRMVASAGMVNDDEAT